MLVMRPFLSITLSVFLAGCFQPDPSKVTIICSSDAPGQCPEGQRCLNGQCGVADPAVSDAGPVDSGSDAATPQPDMAVAGCKTAIGVPVADSAACDSVTGFFVADQPAYWMGTMSQETCGTAISNQLFYGCGAAGRAGAKKCGGLPRVIDLGSGWTSSNGTLANASNTQASQGVLCCKAGFKAVGCPGAFAMGDASKQCAPGWAPCQTLP